MTTREHILALLADTEATTGAIAECLHMPCKVVAAFLQDLELEDLISRRTIAGSLDAWRRSPVAESNTPSHP